MDTFSLDQYTQKTSQAVTVCTEVPQHDYQEEMSDENYGDFGCEPDPEYVAQLQKDLDCLNIRKNAAETQMARKDKHNPKGYISKEYQS